MDVQPSHRLRRHRRRRRHMELSLCGDDRISALPEDMLIQILVRLGSARDAARTGILSRRWCGLWARLPDLTFRDVPAGKIEAALASVALPAAVSLLDISFPSFPSTAWSKADDVRAKSLLRAAARLSPEEFVFVLPQPSIVKPDRPVKMAMPCFRRAKSIELDTRHLRLKPPRAGELPLLESLSLSGNIVDLGTMLSRCPRLRVLRVTFRDADPDSLEAALASLEAAAGLGLVVSLLHINTIAISRTYSIGMYDIGAARLASLLGAMARISPEELILSQGYHECYNVDLPCFHRTTVIEMCLYSVRFTLPPTGEFPFPALERLSLQFCIIADDLATLVTQCPRLRVLKATTYNHAHSITVYSTSLEELYLYARHTEYQSIYIVTPLLKQLVLDVEADTDVNLSITAPMVEEVVLERTYTKLHLVFDFDCWLLDRLRLMTRESYKYKDNDQEGACSQLLPRFHVLILDIIAFNYSRWYEYDGMEDVMKLNFEHEMNKLSITNFSMLELNLNTQGHAFGALMLCLLEMHQIRTAIRGLKVILPASCEMSQTQ